MTRPWSSARFLVSMTVGMAPRLPEPGRDRQEFPFTEVMTIMTFWDVSLMCPAGRGARRGRPGAVSRAG
jgi:hypothetical protein